MRHRQDRFRTHPLRWIGVLALASACSSKPAAAPAAAAGPRTLPPNLQTTATAFGNAVLAKDYEGAYAMMAAAYRQDMPYPEFLTSITRYRDRFEETPKLEVRASDDPPEALKDDGMVQMLVPEHLRSQILGEAILDFGPAAGEGEGFVLVMWLVDEAGQVRILNYYQDD